MKTLIQGGYIVGFNGAEHEIIKDGAVVFDGNRIEFVGKEYAQPVDKRIDAKGCLVSPGFIDTHFHSGINASDYILNDSTKPISSRRIISPTAGRCAQARTRPIS
jgi:cytosine/adenosine deaminase-related metal-dependent hydrolase